jgi:hypothetical protein
MLLWTFLLRGFQFDISIYRWICIYSQQWIPFIQWLGVTKWAENQRPCIVLTCGSSLDISFTFDTNVKITTPFYDKLDDFNFNIPNFPHLCSNIPSSTVIYIFYLIWCSRACSIYDQFLIQISILMNKLISRRFLQSCLQTTFRKSSGHYNNLFWQYNLSLATCCVICSM